MDVIRHQYGEMTKPILLLVVKADGIENGGANDVLAEMILLSRLSAEGNEIICVCRDPMRCFVIDVFAKWHGQITAARDSGGYHCRTTFVQRSHRLG